MAKNKHKSKNQSIEAKNSMPSIENQAAISTELTAQNALASAMQWSSWDGFNFNQSLSSQNAYNNVSLELLTLQQMLVTYLYKQFGILAKVVDIPVDDAYKQGGFDLEADSINEKELKELQNILIKHQDIEKLKTARKWARLFGGGALIAISGDDLGKPINFSSLYKQPLDFMPVERWQLAYSKPNVNIRGGLWNLVQYGRVDANSAKPIHDSRVFILNGKVAPYLILQQTQGWGISVFEQIFQDMSQFFKSRNVLFELLDEAKTDVLKLATMQTALTSAAGKRALQMMVDTIAANKNYKSQITLSKDDDYEQKQISFSGFEGILREIRVMIAGSANMPVNKLWGEGVTGFGSGEDSLENYNSQIENEVRTPDYSVLNWILKLRCYQLFGREVKDLVIDWKNLRVLSAIDEQNINDKKLANVLQLFDRQLLTPQETMQYLKKQQIFIHETKALKGELDDMPLNNNPNQEEKETKDIVKE